MEKREDQTQTDKTPKTAGEADASEPPGSAEAWSNAPARSRPSRGRIWLFRLVSLLVIPAAFFLLLELGLRLFGYGYDTRYFVPAPAELARQPEHLCLDSSGDGEAVRTDHPDPEAHEVRPYPTDQGTMATSGWPKRRSISPASIGRDSK